MTYDIDDRDIQPLAVPSNGLKALIDADTIVVALCATNQIETDVFDTNMNTTTEMYIDEVEVAKLVLERVEEYLKLSGCADYELHFTRGKDNFRYYLNSEYKANRKNATPIVGINEVKDELTRILKDGKVFNHYVIEADEAVVAKYEASRLPDSPTSDKFVLFAVDKDVLGCTYGRSFNYFSRFFKANKEGVVKPPILPHYVFKDRDEAIRQPYIQCLMGDSSDGINGLKGVGIKTATKHLGELTDLTELWNKVLELYKKKGKTESDAVDTMRLVKMDMFKYDNSTGLYSVDLFMEDEYPTNNISSADINKCLANGLKLKDFYE